MPDVRQFRYHYGIRSFLLNIQTFICFEPTHCFRPQSGNLLHIVWPVFRGTKHFPKNGYNRLHCSIFPRVTIILEIPTLLKRFFSCPRVVKLGATTSVRTELCSSVFLY